MAVDLNASQKESVEQDIIRNRCAALRKCMRERPCLPVKDGSEPMTYDDVASGFQLPMYTRPSLECAYHSNDRATFLHHVACGVSDREHLKIFEVVRNDDLPWMNRLHYVYGAIAIAERE